MKIVNKIDNNSKNRNKKIDFSIISAHCASFMNIGPFLIGGVCISLLGTWLKKSFRLNKILDLEINKRKTIEKLR